MKTIKAYEFKDLSKSVKGIVRDDEREKTIEFQLVILENDFSDNRITEKKYYEKLGCDKNYAETTGWFVPSCYYDKNKNEVEKIVKERLNDMLFSVGGNFIEYIN